MKRPRTRFSALPVSCANTQRMLSLRSLTAMRSGERAFSVLLARDAETAAERVLGGFGVASAGDLMVEYNFFFFFF